jgi:hypothetical protein
LPPFLPKFNLVFTALNIYWICRLLLERLPVKLSADEQRLCELVFRTMTPREMIKLLKLATWENAEAGECFVERDKPLDRLMVIYSGKACAEVDGQNCWPAALGRPLASPAQKTNSTRPRSRTTSLRSMLGDADRAAKIRARSGSARSMGAREHAAVSRVAEFDRRGVELVTPSGNRLFALAGERVRG